MRYSELRVRALDETTRFLPLVFTAAFVFSYYTRLGTIAILALCAWYLVWNGPEVLKQRWALAFIGFFALITLKDALMWALGQGAFKSFAKSGSRVFVLAGCAAMIAAVERKKLEKALVVALGLMAFVVGAATLGRHLNLLPLMFNRNAFGMTAAWLPLAIAAKYQARGQKRDTILAAAWLAGGFAVLCLDAAFSGSRTAPAAFAFGALFVLFSRRKGVKTAAAAAVVLAVLAIGLLSATKDARIDRLLTKRQELWNAYAAKGAERPLVGWGYTEAEDNKRLMSDLLRDQPIFESFTTMGQGPHNAFLAMFFENGIVAALLFAALFVLRALKVSSPLTMFDASLIAYIAFMSADAMNPGGLTFLGFYLGICLLALGPGAAAASTKATVSADASADAPDQAAAS